MDDSLTPDSLTPSSSHGPRIEDFSAWACYKEPLLEGLTQPDLDLLDAYPRTSKDLKALRRAVDVKHDNAVEARRTTIADVVEYVVPKLCGHDRDRILDTARAILLSGPSMPMPAGFKKAKGDLFTPQSTDFWPSSGRVHRPTWVVEAIEEKRRQRREKAGRRREETQPD